MLPRSLEPEVMDSVEEARDYNSIGHSEVNRAFVDNFLEAVESSSPPQPSGEAGFLAEYGHTLSREQRQVLLAVIRCRTAQLGGHVQQCDDCGHQRIQYNSCRNRHCPKCQAMARARPDWFGPPETTAKIAHPGTR